MICTVCSREFSPEDELIILRSNVLCYRCAEKIAEEES